MCTGFLVLEYPFAKPYSIIRATGVSWKVIVLNLPFWARLFPFLAVLPQASAHASHMSRRFGQRRALLACRAPQRTRAASSNTRGRCVANLLAPWVVTPFALFLKRTHMAGCSNTRTFGGGNVPKAERISGLGFVGVTKNTITEISTWRLCSKFISHHWFCVAFAEAFFDKTLPVATGVSWKS